MSDPEVKQKIINILAGNMHTREAGELADQIMDALTDTMMTLAENAAASEHARCIRNIRSDCSALVAQCAIDAIKGGGE